MFVGNACTKHATTEPKFLGDFSKGSAVDPSALSPELAARWAALQQAWADDPASPTIPALADAVLEHNPPAEIVLETMLVKASHAYTIGDDLAAIALAEQALSQVGRAVEANAAVLELRRLVLRAHVRGGDPSVALQQLANPNLVELFEPSDLIGMRAVAFDRADRRVEAVAAFAQWRSLSSDQASQALYAEQRMRALALSASDALDAQKELGDRAQKLSPWATVCLGALSGRASPSKDAPAWVRRCANPPATIGVLLPRTGPLSALADTQLAAATVAASTLVGATPARKIIWQDAGGSRTTAVRGAKALLARGAQVIVGPIGPRQIRAVSKVVGDSAQIIVPGEAVGDRAQGVAPSLEARLKALVEHAKAQGTRRFLVAVPDNGYGRRALKALKVFLADVPDKDLIIQTYPTSTTSFAPIIAPLFGALRKGSALFLPDHLSRVELMLRQLARSGRPAALAGEGLLVLSTAEGADASSLARGGSALSNLLVAPTAVQLASAQSFVQAYYAAQGELPGDQALLVYYAFERAFAGGAQAAPPQAVVQRVEAGTFVAP